jgi:hypothetical protein
MAKYKQVEFAELCNITRGQVSVYVKRGNLVIEDGVLDDRHPINNIFIQKRRAKQSGAPEPARAAASVPKPKPRPSDFENDEDDFNSDTEAKKRQKNRKRSGESDYGTELIRQQELKNEKVLEEIALLRKRNMKMDGEAIPTSAVLSVISFFGKAYTDGTQQFMDNFLNSISARKGLSSAEYAEFRGTIIKGINEIATRANRESKKNISNIIQEFSNSRGVGEHD